MTIAIRVRMPAPLQFIRMTTSIFGDAARQPSPLHHRARSLGLDRQGQGFAIPREGSG
jgi:hypothetical protein